MGYKIINKEKINSVTQRLDIEAPRVAKKAKAGQFIMLRIDENGERIPLTITAHNASSGTVSVIFQIVGCTTKKLSLLTQGSEIMDFIGPLGRPTQFGCVGKTVFIGGGVGIAELLPVISYAREQGNYIVTILGARTKELLILRNDIQKLSDETLCTTDDGSFGEKGLVINPLKRLLERSTFNLCYTVGPDIMMKAVCDETKKYGLKTLVSLDANMVDATGMCGTCRVTVGGKVRFTCVDGPEFDGHTVHWDEFMTRQKRFAEEEKICNELHAQPHQCQKRDIKSNPL